MAGKLGAQFSQPPLLTHCTLVAVGNVDPISHEATYAKVSESTAAAAAPIRAPKPKLNPVQKQSLQSWPFDASNAVSMTTVSNATSTTAKITVINANKPNVAAAKAAIALNSIIIDAAIKDPITNPPAIASAPFWPPDIL